MALQGLTLEPRTTVDQYLITLLMDDPKNIAQIVRQGITLALAKYGQEL